MLGFGKKKKQQEDTKEFSLMDVSYLNKQELLLHTKLKEKLDEHLLPHETLIGETGCAGGSYFLTDRRIIMICQMIPKKVKEKKPIKQVKVESLYYGEISSVTYQEGILGFGSLKIHLKGNIVKGYPTFYEKPCKEIYKLLNSKIDYNMNLATSTNIGVTETINKQDEELAKQQALEEEKNRNKELIKAKGEEVANKLFEKTKGLFKK